MAEEHNPKQERQSTSRAKHAKRKLRSGNFVNRFLKVIGTILCIGIVTCAMLVYLFMTYVETSLSDQLDVEVTDYEMVLSSIIYYEDKDTGEWEELNTLYKDENRIWVDFEEMPDEVWEALIAIEDQRFYTHRGVDLRRTGGAVLNMFLGMRDTFGGSTITQQLIKNLTGEKEGTVKRKVTEIFRALEFEKKYSKEEILELYLNRVYFGEQCNGVGSAAKVYFGKEVSELTLAEIASIIGITNNPSQYDPFISDWTKSQNKKRQETILAEMLDQEWISEAEYEEAVAQELVFTTEKERREAEAAEAAGEATGKKNKYYSYFVDAAIEECISIFMDEYGWNYDTAEIKLFNGGYRIYLTMDMDIQEIAEGVYENIENINYTSSTGQQLQSAITIMDPYTGDVVAMVGGVGEKTGSRVLNRALSLRQIGSAIKPISTYAPALDAGVISNASSIDDYPVRVISGRAWPVNSGGGYRGLVPLRTAVASSLNPCAVRVNEALGVANSYAFLENNLGISSLVSDDLQSASLALGGLTNGMNTKEVCAAYSAFVNNGVYTKPRLVSKITDADGNIVIDNQAESWVAMKDTTAYFVNELLQAVITEGTATRAGIPGMTVAGKTGTTSNNFDRYFVGYTPYYCAAVWTGYDINEKIQTSSNPAVTMWKLVMTEIHAGLENRSFNKPDSGFTSVTVCADSGLKATAACAADVRGSRVKTMTVANGTAPTEECNIHTMVQYCTEGQCLSDIYCPAESVTEKAVLDYTRETLANVSAATPADYIYTLAGIGATDSGGGATTPGTTTPDPSLPDGTVAASRCPVHTTPPAPPVLEDPIGGEGGTGIGEGGAGTGDTGSGGMDTGGTGEGAGEGGTGESGGTGGGETPPNDTTGTGDAMGDALSNWWNSLIGGDTGTGAGSAA